VPQVAIPPSSSDLPGAVFALALAAERRDSTTAGHGRRLAALAVRLGQKLRLSDAELKILRCAGFLHDIGKVAIPDSILLKSGPLTEDEWVVMCTHTTHGEEICRPLDELQAVLPVIRHHHEKWDGSGYPDGLRGEEIPLLARILQVADIYDALTTPRPYKAGMSTSEALAVLREEARRGWRDPVIVEAFASLFPSWDAPVGQTA
jgi:putative two-component system response regulator